MILSFPGIDLEGVPFWLARIVAWSGAEEFANTWGEKHAIAEGIMAGLRCNDPTFALDYEGLPALCPEDVKANLRAEWHYYDLGYTIGWAAQQRTWRATGAATLAIADFWWTYRPVAAAA
jgi:hypothetical protein